MVRFTVVVLLTALLQSVTAFQPVASFPSTLVQQGDSRTVALPPVSFLSRRRAPEDWLPNRRNSKTRLFVFERMSEDCIAGVVQAQQEAATLQLARVGTVVMMAGCLSQPESNALKRTMRAYAITSREASRTLPAMYKEHARNETLNNNGWLSGFRAAKDDDDRPFSPKLKRTFVMAGRLADQMGSTLIQPNHIFLALLEYEESKEGVKKAAEKCDDLSDINNCGAWGLLKMMNSFDEEVSALTICQSLIDNMVNEETDEKELVTGVGPVSKTPTLEECGTDLTELARDGLLDPVFGRDQEIRSCMRTLIRRRKNNVCLTGEPGVGKTAIAEGVAQVLIDPAQCPARLEGYRLISLELSTLVAGTRYRGEFEERLQSIVKEVTDPNAPPTILFIDEIHNLVGAGAAEGGMDAANMLKPALARGELQLIGATTIMEYRKYIEKDAALERRLQPVLVKEPSIEATLSILEGVQSYYERHHGVTYTPEALEAAVVLSDRYITDRFLPDKALDLMDEAGAIIQLELIGNETGLVDEHAVAGVIGEWSGIPMGKLELKELDRLRSLEGDMMKRVKGQGRAVRGVSRAVRRARSGLRDPKRPIASFLFCGPTGTGKTELCKTLAETYFGSEKETIRLDMSEYIEKHSVSRLIGSPPGYIGFDEGGQLTEAVRRAPHSVVLLDEIEKAHGDVLNILLQIMEDGMLTDGKGRTVNFKNAILVMTSNVGSRRILDIVRSRARADRAPATSKLPIEVMQPEFVVTKKGKKKKKANGSSAAKKDNRKLETEPMELEVVEKANGAEVMDHPLYAELVSAVKEELEVVMRPELLNRIDEIVVFSPLARDDLRMIARILVDKTIERALQEQKMDLTVEESVVSQIMEEGSANADQFGARPMRRAAQRFVEDSVSDAIVQGFLKEGDAATVGLGPRKGRRYTVQIQRKHDDELMFVDIEDADGGIGSAQSLDFPRLANGSEAESALSSETDLAVSSGL